MPITGSLALYFHVPFCRSICPYCDVYTIPDQKEYHTLYLDSVLREIELSCIKNHGIKSIYFGGGSPATFLDGCTTILSFLESNHSLKNIEITLELNPEDMSEESLKKLIPMGVNRLSIAVETRKESLLLFLQRQRLCLKALGKAFVYIPNISIDLMYGIPNQSVQDLLLDLAWLEKTCVSHVSLQELVIEPNTIFAEKDIALPSNEQSRILLQEYIQGLEKLGFERYTLFDFAKNKNYALHNQEYYTGNPYLGFGPSSHSYYKTRWHNVSNLFTYANGIENNKAFRKIEKPLSKTEKQKEHFALQLRFIRGVFLPSFIQENGPICEELQKSIDNLQEKDFLEEHNKHIRLTKKGAFFYDSVASEVI